MKTKLIFVFAALFAGFQILMKIPPIFDRSPKLSLMSFNVENLFDTKASPSNGDRTYLPISKKRGFEHRALCSKIEVRKWREDCLYLDWSEKVLLEKLSRIASVIRSATYDRRGPDLVLLQEVENIEVLMRLVREFLPDSGYQPILIEGKDERGIDVALLTRLKLGGRPVLHEIPYEKQTNYDFVSRGLLDVPLEDSRFGKVRVFVLHLPSAFHSSKRREEALRFLNARASQVRDALVVAGGDFNISSYEEEKTRLLDRHTKARWHVTHLEGCHTCRGTVEYRGKWSFFDQIWMARSSEILGWRMRPGSVRLVNKISFQRRSKIWGLSRPRRFEVSRQGQVDGISDHWPIYAELELSSHKGPLEVFIGLLSSQETVGFGR